MKVLFIAPHLSTGGMPAFLLKRIQALKQYSDIELFVIEWRCYSSDFVVQRNQIQNLLGENFISFFGDKEVQKNITKFCYDKEIDIIHMEEIPEGFDSFNPFDEEIQKELYDPKHPWRIIETPHGMWFNPTKSKKYHPNGYACVTEEHASKTYNIKGTVSTLIPFPVDLSIQSNLSREQILTEKNFQLYGEHHILNVGLWTEGKNQKYALEIAKELWDRYKYSYIFHFVGNQAPNFSSYWEPLMDNITPNVLIHGERSDIDKFFKMSDMMLFTSTWECNPIVLKEAISNNIKIMAYDLSHYGSEYKGIITPLTGDLETDVSNLLKDIHSNPKYNLGDLSNSVEVFASKHIKFYKFLLNEGTPRRTNFN